MSAMLWDYTHIPLSSDLCKAIQSEALSCLATLSMPDTPAFAPPMFSSLCFRPCLFLSYRTSFLLVVKKGSVFLQSGMNSFPTPFPLIHPGHQHPPTTSFLQFHPVHSLFTFIVHSSAYFHAGPPLRGLPALSWLKVSEID